MNNNKVQNFIANYFAAYFEEKTNAKLLIGDISMKYFNEISLDSLYLEDLNNKELASIGHVDAKLNIIQLIKGEIYFNDIYISNLNANLIIDKNGEPNFKYLSDFFKPKNNVNTPNIKLPLITLENASIHFINKCKKKKLKKIGNFNPNNVHIKNLNTQIQFNLINKTDITASIYYLNFKEKCGFKVSNIQATTNISDSTLNIPYINIDLPKTHINLDSIYTEIDNKNDNIDWSKTIVNFNITNSQINLSDFGCIIPEVANLRNTAYLSANIKGNLAHLKAKNFKLKYGDVISTKMNITADSLYDINNSFFSCNINHIRFDRNSIQDIIANINKKPFILPKELNNLGICNYSGKISGKISNLVLYGKLSTEIGNIKTDFNLKMSDNYKTFKIDGRIGSDKLALGQLVPNSGLGNIVFKSNSKISFNTKKDITADTKIKIEQFTYNHYKYKNILIDGIVSPTSFSGKFTLNDPNGYLYFDGSISQKEDFKAFKFDANIDNLNLNKLKIIKTHPDLNFSLNINSDFSGIKWSNMNGYLKIDSLHLRNKDKLFDLTNLTLTANNDSISYANISSDIINGGFSGEYNLTSLPNSMLYSLSKTMPILNKFNIKEPKRNNSISFYLEIEPIKQLCKVLDLDWFTTDKSSVAINYDSNSDIINSEIIIPRISNNKTNIDSIIFNFNNSKSIQTDVSFQTNLKKGKIDLALGLNASNDSILSTISWDNHNKKDLLAGELITLTSLKSYNDKDSIVLNSTILPTELILFNKSWIVNQSEIWSNFKELAINNFIIRSEDDQLITIDGVASKNKSEKIDIKLSDISLDYIDQLLPEDTKISFGGTLNGDASIANVLNIPEINANVVSDNLYFDGAYFGKTIASCEFDLNTKSLNFNGTVINDNQDTTAILTGNYFIPNDSLDLIGKAYGLDIAFIDYYIEDVFGKVTGKGWGDVHVYGITKSKNIAVDVDALADSASIYVDFLKTKFFLTDSIHLDKNIIDFGEIEIKDIYGNKGIVKGKINHEYFKDIELDLAIDVDNMLAMDTKREDSESFYGKVFGSGRIVIKGDEKQINIACKAKSEQGTNITIPIDNYYAEENSFIIFQSNTNKEIRNESSKSSTNEEIDNDQGTNVVLDLMIDITPDANVQLYIDSKTGDMLKGSGSGNLRVTYDTNAEELKIYGTCQIEHGSYLFTFQNALRKEFYIKEGSTISWTGDPLNAKLNLDAYYQLNADLAEILDEAALTNTTRTTVPVQCILNLSGILTQPNIKFDINLPNSEEELNRALKNTLNTEELMNRQIIGLLILGKFISPETMQNSVISQNELYSVVSSTLSSQLNNWASQMFNNWNFGVNFRTTGEGETRSNEYEFNFVYTPTKRIIINGNVGYRDDAMSATNFIGDFDIEYKLIESGRLRAKAYTHTNDYREFKKGLTTQGVGIIFSENFNSLPELWKNWKDNAKKNKKERAIRKEERKQRKIAKKKMKEENKKKSSKDDRKD